MARLAAAVVVVVWVEQPLPTVAALLAVASSLMAWGLAVAVLVMDQPVRATPIGATTHLGGSALLALLLAPQQVPGLDMGRAAQVAVLGRLAPLAAAPLVAATQINLVPARAALRALAQVEIQTSHGSTLAHVWGR